jgi:hypothetical protein
MKKLQGANNKKIKGKTVSIFLCCSGDLWQEAGKHILLKVIIFKKKISENVQTHNPQNPAIPKSVKVF